MLVWGLASREVEEAIELYSTRAETAQALEEVLADEPGCRDLLFVTPIELAAPDAAVSLN
jgi:hypothetical protein